MSVRVRVRFEGTSYNYVTARIRHARRRSKGENESSLPGVRHMNSLCPEGGNECARELIGVFIGMHVCDDVHMIVDSAVFAASRPGWL